MSKYKLPHKITKCRIWDTHEEDWFCTWNGNEEWNSPGAAKGACKNRNRWMRENGFKKFDDQDRYIVVTATYELKWVE